MTQGNGWNEGKHYNLEHFVESRFEELLRNGRSEPLPFRRKFMGTALVTLPDIKTGNTLEVITLPLRVLEFQYQVVPMRFLIGDGRDPYLVDRRHELKNVLTGDRTLYDPQQVSPDLNSGATTDGQSSSSTAPRNALQPPSIVARGGLDGIIDPFCGAGVFF